MTEKLKSCPFCGNLYKLEIKSHSGSWFYVYCKTCGAAGGISEFKQIAVNIWNMRYFSRKEVRKFLRRKFINS